MRRSPEFSIIVPFVSWNSYVEECVNRCLKMEGPSFELILVSDTPIKPLKDRRIKVVVSGKKNIPQKRNIGIKKSSKSSKYFAFIDSDAYPRKDWLKNAAVHLKKDYAAVGGPNITPPGDGIGQKCVGNALKSFFCGGPRSFQVNGKSKSRLCSDLPTCNLIVARDFMKKIGGFDESLQTGEDLKMCYGIRKAGGKIFFSKDVVVYHHRRHLFRPFLAQRYVYGRSVPGILRKDRSASNIYLLAPAAFLVFLAAGLVLSFIFKQLLPVYTAVVALFLLVSLIETVRHSKAGEAPTTYAAFVTGVLAPGAGTIVSVFNPDYSVKGVYSNYKDNYKDQQG